MISPLPSDVSSTPRTAWIVPTAFSFLRDRVARFGGDSAASQALGLVAVQHHQSIGLQRVEPAVDQPLRQLRRRAGECSAWQRFFRGGAARSVAAEALHAQIDDALGHAPIGSQFAAGDRDDAGRTFHHFVTARNLRRRFVAGFGDQRADAGP